MVIAKGVTGGGSSWWVRHKSVASTNVLELNSSNAKADYSSVFNNTLPSSTVVTLGSGDTNRSGETQILYCFHDITGYQKFGSYTGNAGTQTITTGFQPDFVMIKRADSTGNWVIIDSPRASGGSRLYSNLNSEEHTSQGESFVSTGFKPRTSSTADTNISGGTYIYWAIKIN